MKDPLTRSVRNFLLHIDATLGDWLGAVVLLGWALIFLFHIGGLLESIVRAVTGLSAIAVLVFRFLNLYEDARKHHRSAGIERIEKVILTILWVLIGSFVLLKLLFRQP